MTDPKPQPRLTKGNSKLGKTIFTFNLPAITTCPGRSLACQSCYAMQGRWLFDNVRRSLARNLEAARSPSFATDMVAEIRRRKAAVVRVHSSGDFFSRAYARRWLTVMRELPGVTFYFYTRSWRIGSIRPVLEEMAALPNVRAWFSADADTGVPEAVPPGVRVAWLHERHGADVPQASGVVFRVHELRRAVQKRIGLPLVCPVENGVTSTDCGRCGVCWR